MLKSTLGIARQSSGEKFAIFSLKLRSHVRILINRMWAILKKKKAEDFGTSEDSRLATQNDSKSIQDTT